MIRLGIPETMFKPLFMNSPAGFQMFCSNIMFQISIAVVQSVKESTTTRPEGPSISTVSRL